MIISTKSKTNLHVGSRQTIVCIEAKRDILCQDGRVALSGCQFDLVLGDLLGTALDLLKVQAHV